jgi:AcrR family transcriptional regulator
VSEQPGRRERKKAATRKLIADVALRLFLEHGYDAVGLREVAKEADVAVTTLFAHFPSKEAMVFDTDKKREDHLVRAVTGRDPDVTVLQALREELRVAAREFTSSGSKTFWRLVDSSPALREYASTMWLRHEEALAAAIAHDLGLPEGSTPCRALARFVLDVYSLARAADDPKAAVEEIFDLIGAGWDATLVARQG